MLGIAPEGPPGKGEIHWYVLGQATGNVMQDLIHAGQFQYELSPRFQDPLPFREHRPRLPFIDMLQHMNRGDTVYGIRHKRECPYVPTDAGSLQIDIEPSCPVAGACPQVEGQAWMTRLHATATVLGEYRCET